MVRKASITRWTSRYISQEKIFEPDSFNIVKSNIVKREKEGGETSYTSRTFNLLKYKVMTFDIDQIRMAIIRARQDYGKTFERLAAED